MKNITTRGLMSLTPLSMTVRSLALLAMLFATARCSADYDIPPGVSPGEKFHFVFITQGTYGAFGTTLAQYDTIVQAEAEMNGSMTGTDQGINYRILGSTDGEDARDHTAIEGKVFLFDGTKIADSFDDMWDESLDNPMNVDQFGNVRNNAEVYTGTFSNGFSWNCPDANYALGQPIPRFGSSSITDETWSGIGDDFNNVPRHFWGISEAIIAPGVPEPGTGLVCLGAALLLIGRRRRIR